MGMSTKVIFLRKKDDAHQKKVTVLRACLAANVHLPSEIEEYFEGSYDENWPLQIEVEEAVTTLSLEECTGIEVELNKLPEGIKTIRFCNSW